MAEASASLDAPEAFDPELARLHTQAYTTMRDIGTACASGTDEGFIRATALIRDAKPQFAL